MPDSITLPPVTIPREAQQDPYLREIEIDPREYYPDDVYREIVTSLPEEFTIDLRPMREQWRKKLAE